MLSRKELDGYGERVDAWIAVTKPGTFFKKRIVTTVVADRF